MKKLLILTLLIPLLSFSQFRKMEDVAKMQGGWAIVISFNVDEITGESFDTTYLIMCQNAEYKYLNDIFCIYGTKDFNEFKQFINWMGEMIRTMPTDCSKEFPEYNLTLFRVKLLNDTPICFTQKKKSVYLNKVTYNRLVKKISQLNN